MPQYLRQGTLRFAPGFKLQTRWGLSEASVFTLECAGAPLVALAAITQAGIPATATGVAFVVAAIALLLNHLGRPLRSWRAIANFRHAWISRGSVALTLVVVVGLWHLLVQATADAPGDSATQAVIAVVLLFLGAFIGTYPGFVLSSSPAIPFWNSALLPVLSLLQGVSAALLLLAAFLAGSGNGLPWVGPAALMTLTALGILLALYVGVMRGRDGAARESANYLLRCHPGQFAFGACACGIVLPLVIVFAWVAGSVEMGLMTLTLAAVARLAGDVALRHAFLKVGMYEPVV